MKDDIELIQKVLDNSVQYMADLQTAKNIYDAWDRIRAELKKQKNGKKAVSKLPQASVQ